jgi:2-polyprenyl-6-methoxyphenol hydroxylase-like FAD-dependent oxidoreductase
MQSQLRVLVVGCGTAGAAAALFLSRAGHVVTVVEHVAEPLPVGAGLMLQPTGQAVLRLLGLDAQILREGARIDTLRVLTRTQREILRLAYSDVSAAYFGLGIHRGVLFQALFGAVRACNIDLKLGVSGTSLRREGATHTLITESGAEWGPFDLVVVADGAKSRFRSASQLTRRAEPYPWGALWYMADDSEGIFRDELYQVVHGTQKLVGLLPTGRDLEGKNKVSIFYSVRADQVQSVRAGGVRAFRAALTQLVPRSEPLVAQLEDMSQLLLSGYHDVVMQPWHTRAIVHIGDAGHAMSPQLGQGANLALYDAYVLAESVAYAPTVSQALDAYSRRREAHLAYYQVVTRALTPFFQSDYAALGFLRDTLMPIACRIAPLRRAMVLGMCGLADGHPWKRVSLPQCCTSGHQLLG